MKNKLFFIKIFFLVFCLFLAFFSLFFVKDNFLENKKNLVFVLDVSKSMNVADVNWQTRLDFAKKIIEKNLEKADNFSLLIFSGEAKNILSITNDKNNFLKILKNIDFRNLEKQGSDFLSPFLLLKNNYENLQKTLIFISDGWDEDDKISEKIADFKDKNTKYLIFWVGSKLWWKIWFFDEFWENQENKNFVSKLTEKNLQKISSFIWWKYFKINEISDLEKIDLFEKNSDFPFFIIFILIFLSFIFYIIFYIFDFKKYDF